MLIIICSNYFGILGTFKNILISQFLCEFETFWGFREGLSCVSFIEFSKLLQEQPLVEFKQTFFHLIFLIQGLIITHFSQGLQLPINGKMT